MDHEAKAKHLHSLFSEAVRLRAKTKTTRQAVKDAEKARIDLMPALEHGQGLRQFLEACENLALERNGHRLALYAAQAAEMRAESYSIGLASVIDKD